MTSPIISAIVTFHAEGIIAHRTLQGIERLRCYAEMNGIMVEIVLVLDCADKETIRVINSSSVLRDYDQVIEVSNRDLGASRNSGIQVARGNYIGIFDGDDYCTDNWLVEALKISRAAAGHVVVHPELTISFGSVYCVAYSLDMNKQPNYPLQNCLSVHPWISCSFGAKFIYENSPYCRTDTKETGFGFEDWQWNLEAIAKGCLHVCALGTAHYYRRKPASMVTEMMSTGAVIRPTAFFDHPESWNTGFQTNGEPFTNAKNIETGKLIPQWAIEGFRQIAEIEPELYPTEEFLRKFILYTPPLDLGPGDLYAKIFALLGGYKPDTICLVPWLAWKSRDDAGWQETFATASVGKKVLVITSTFNDTPLNRKVPEEFKLLAFGKLARDLSDDQQIQVLTRLILQSNASELYVINSPLGWKLIKRHGKSFVATGKRIYAQVYDLGPNRDQNETREQYIKDITPCLSEYATGSSLAQSQISAWESMALHYTTRRDPIGALLNRIRSHRIFQLIKRFLD